MFERIKNICIAILAMVTRTTTGPMRWACAGLIALATSVAAVAQPVHRDVRVDIVNGSINGDGSAWGSDAFRFLQDALEYAADHVSQQQGNTADIWVASACCTLTMDRPWYRPDQRAIHGSNADCPPFGNCDPTASFELRDNVHIYGGFPSNPHLWNGGQGATFEDRDPDAYPTILSGDLRAVNVSANAVLDGFIIQGGIELRGARPLFRDCVIALHEGAAVRCLGGSHVMFHRCTFTGAACGALVVDEGSRLELLACEPATALAEAPTSGKARIASCSILLVADRAMMMRW